MYQLAMAVNWRKKADDFVEHQFRAPVGHPMSSVGLSGGLLLAFQFCYYGLRSGEWLPYSALMAIGLTTHGLTEALPDGHRRLAGALRMTTIGFFITILTTILLEPDLLLEPI
jgi:hypothetical protein